jgi:DUF3102 family protein
LGKRVVGDVIEIGRRLTEARALCPPRGGWYAWLEKVFGWTDDTARNFMNVYEMSITRNFRGLSLLVSDLYLLARPSTPELVLKAVIERAEAGEYFTHAQVKDMIAKAVAEARPDFEAELARLKDQAEVDAKAKIEAEPALLRQEADRSEEAVRAQFADLCLFFLQYRLKFDRV